MVLVLDRMLAPSLGRHMAVSGSSIRCHTDTLELSASPQYITHPLWPKLLLHAVKTLDCLLKVYPPAQFR